MINIYNVDMEHSQFDDGIESQCLTPAALSLPIPLHAPVDTGLKTNPIQHLAATPLLTLERQL